MADSLQRNTFKNFLWLFAGSSSQSALQIFVLAILARLVTPAEFGIIGVAMIFLGFSKILSQLGMGAAIVQREEISDNHIRTAYTVSLFTGVMIAIMAVVFSNPIAIYFDMPELSEVLNYMSCIFIIDSFMAVSGSLLQRELRIKQIALSELISYLIGFGVLGVILAYLDYGLFALVYAYIAQAVIRAGIVFYLAPHRIVPYFDRNSFSALFHFGGWHTIAKIANYLAGQGDYLIIGKTLNASALGYYSRAYQIMVAPVRLIGQSLNIVLFPTLASVQKDLPKVRRAFYKSTKLVAFASLVISAVLIVNAREIVLILLGENWLDVIVPFQILASGTVFRMSYKISDSLAKALGEVYKRALYQILYAASVLAFSYAGHFWGIEGVATGVVIAIFINFLLMTHLTLSRLKEDWSKFFLIHFKPLVAAAVTAVFCAGLLWALRTQDWNLMLTEVIYLVVSIVFLLSLFLRFRRQLGISEEIDMILKR